MIAGMEWEYAWSNEEVDDFINCWNAGMDDFEIARILGRRHPEVVILRMDLAEKKLLPERKDSQHEVVVKIRKKRSVRASNINVKVLMQLYKDPSMTIQDIAHSMGYHPRTISGVIKREFEKNPALWPRRTKKVQEAECKDEPEDENQTVIDDFIRPVKRGNKKTGIRFFKNEGR